MYHRRPLFFPIVLITLGVLFLLNNLDIAPDLGDLISDWWPLILVVLGIDMLLRRREWPGQVFEEEHESHSGDGSEDSGRTEYDKGAS